MLKERTFFDVLCDVFSGPENIELSEIKTGPEALAKDWD